MAGTMIATLLRDNHENMIPRNNISVEHENISVRPESAPLSAGDACARPVRIWLVDDSKNFRTLLAHLLNDQPRFQCERDFPSAEAVLEALARELPPDVILLDIDMGGMSGLDAIRPIKSLAVSTRVLLLTSFCDSYRKAQALREGASDFLLKSYDLEKICSRILQAQEQPITSERVPPSVKPPPVPARPNVLWRGASSGLVRGVGYLREFLGWKRTRAG